MFGTALLFTGIVYVKFQNVKSLMVPSFILYDTVKFGSKVPDGVTFSPGISSHPVTSVFCAKVDIKNWN